MFTRIRNYKQSVRLQRIYGPEFERAIGEMDEVLMQRLDFPASEHVKRRQVATQVAIAYVRERPHVEQETAAMDPRVWAMAAFILCHGLMRPETGFARACTAAALWGNKRGCTKALIDRAIDWAEHQLKQEAIRKGIDIHTGLGRQYVIDADRVTLVAREWTKELGGFQSLEANAALLGMCHAATSATGTLAEKQDLKATDAQWECIRLGLGDYPDLVLGLANFPDRLWRWATFGELIVTVVGNIGDPSPDICAGIPIVATAVREGCIPHIEARIREWFRERSGRDLTERELDSIMDEDARDQASLAEQG